MRLNTNLSRLRDSQGKLVSLLNGATDARFLFLNGVNADLLLLPNGASDHMFLLPNGANADIVMPNLEPLLPTELPEAEFRRPTDRRVREFCGHHFQL